MTIRSVHKLILPAVLAVLAVSGMHAPAMGQATPTPDTNQLIEALRAKSTRGVTAHPEASSIEEDRIIEELAAAGLTPHIVIVNASGGGLTAGIALAVKARAPDARLFTAEPAGFDDHARSFRSGKREVNNAFSGSICDALMSPSPGRITFEINRAMVGEGLAASDEEVAKAVAFAFRELKLVVEPGGAVGLAALLTGKLDVRDKIAVAVLSGGNVDPELFHRLVA